MKMTKSFDVLYCGEFRFIECVKYHKSSLKGASHIYGHFFLHPKGGPSYLNPYSSHSIHAEKLFIDSEKDFKEYIGSDDVIWQLRSDLKNIFPNADGLKKENIQHFLLVIDALKKSKADYTCIITTDLIKPRIEFRKIIQFLTVFDSNEPIMFVNKLDYLDKHNDKHARGFNLDFIVVNKVGRERLVSSVSIALDTYKNLPNLPDLHGRPEFIWWFLSKESGLSLQEINVINTYRFRINFPPDALIGDLNDTLMEEYRQIYTRIKKIIREYKKE